MAGVFGERSAIMRLKCEASVRASGVLEVLNLPRTAILRLMNLNPLIRRRFENLMLKRDHENDYYKTGKVSMMDAVKMVMAAKRLAFAVRHTVKRRYAS